jgi:3-oxoacyl-[acyl-carrier-protein] synthase-1
LLPIYAVSHSVLSPLGNTPQAHVEALMQVRTSIREHTDLSVSAEPFFAARRTPDQMQAMAARFRNEAQVLSPFEQMSIYAVEEALSAADIDAAADDVLLVLSTTKGNIEWLGQQPDERVSIYHSAGIIATHFKLKYRPVIISNACVSGSQAIITAARMLQHSRYRHAIVLGCDRFSGFVFSGFQSFHALAPGPCQPFDANRAGINLGEAAACIILSTNAEVADAEPLALYAGGGLSNDANHLSGPSRTGEELAIAIRSAMREAGIYASQIGAVSAHGTATVFNDEMEAKALALAHINAPIHSFKAYIGHTLGAAGIIESVVACLAMQQQILPATPGYTTPGVPVPVHLLPQPQQQVYDYVLKTASGFGGCNAALVWRKYKP